MTKQYPWDYHEDLTADRLAFVGALIADGRHAALSRYDVEAGDTPWTLGTCAFEFGRQRILRSAASGEQPWLQVIDNSLKLIFQIGEVPIRFYRGEPDEPTNRTLHQSFLELQQTSFIFADKGEGADLLYRFAVETDFDGSVLAITFVGLRGKQPVFSWNVPFEEYSDRVGAVGRPASAPVELPPPDVGLRDPKKKKSGESDEG
jgi:hypothetical protein